MTLTHVRGPIGGVLGPPEYPAGYSPLGREAAPILFGGARPARFFVTPTGRWHDQEDRNSCCAHGFSLPGENVALATGAVIQICRADLYSGALFLDGNEGRDVGVTMGNMGRWMARGVLSEFERPYKTDDVTRRTNPALDARRVTGLTPVRLEKTVDAIKDAILISGGVPIGQEVRTNYRPDDRGVIQAPVGNIDGYHCTELEGLDDNFMGGCFLNRESWKNFGVDHPSVDVDPRFKHLKGKRGYTWRPYAWVTQTNAIFEPTWLKGALAVK